MISVSSAVPVNPPGVEPQLSRDDVWQGLVLKAENALPFVPAMSRCNVLERSGDVIIREIEFRGDPALERVTLTPKQTVTFERLKGNVMGSIRNDIEEDENGKLSLRFSFDLLLTGVEEGSDTELRYAETMQGDYLKAAGATLAAVRRTVAENHPAVSRA